MGRFDITLTLKLASYAGSVGSEHPIKNSSDGLIILFTNLIWFRKFIFYLLSSIRLINSFLEILRGPVVSPSLNFILFTLLTNSSTLSTLTK